jgi:hypothetical protein
MCYSTAYIWFAAAPKKPPDGNMTTITDYLMTVMAYLSYTFEDVIYRCFHCEIDICYWTYIITTFLFQEILNILSIIINIDVNADEHFTDQSWKAPSTTTINYFATKASNRLKMINGSTVLSQVVLSLSSQSNKNDIDDTLIVDTDSYNFAIDTCTTFHVCKHPELFVGEINRSKRIYIQGVGGKIKVTGYGNIKIRVTDDDDKLHDLLIHDVLYVPESPTNLISPQQWSQSSHNPKGTGEITIGGTTVLFWDNHKYSKVVPHHPTLGIPIISVNDGYTQSAAFFNSNTTICRPCMTTGLETSQPIVNPNDHNQVHIIPIEDDEQSIHAITPPAQIIVDELDMHLDNQSQHQHNNAINPPTLIEQMDTNDNTSQASIDTDILSVATVDQDDEGFYIDDTQYDLDDNEEIEIPNNQIDDMIKSVDEGMSKQQRELLTHHYRLKHLPFTAMKRLAKKGVIPKHLAKVKDPLCPSCLMGKQHRRPWRGRGKKRKSIRRPQDNFPGANTSTDQMISPFGGLIPQVRGRLMKAKFYAATIFVDHYTDYTYVHLMKDTTGETTLEAKNAYERLLLSFGSKVLAYHADNGRFAEKLYVQDVKDKAQNITFCGVGSHHQNGIAERRIKSLGEDARTMLAHGQHLWPEVVTKTFWPFAYKAACRARNKFNLDDQGLSSEEKISGITVHQELKNEHPLFCPIYVLDKRLQSGLGGIPKWNPRSNAGVYLGHSPDHASNVALVLSLTTGLVSPQYHVIFDDTFSTVEFIRSKKEPSNWENLCKYHTEDYRVNAMPGNDHLNDIRSELEANINPHPTETVPNPTEVATNDEDQLNMQAQEGEGDTQAEIDVQADTLDLSNTESTEGDRNQINASEGDGLRRSTRIRRQPQRLFNPVTSITQALGYVATYFTNIEDNDNYYAAFKATVKGKLKTHIDKQMHYNEAVELNVDGSYNNRHPLTFATELASNDQFHFHQAMKEPDRDEFIKAMLKEIEDHESRGHWIYVHRKEIGKHKPVKAIWSFKRKRRPDGSLLKHKARLCAHGGMQVYGENYWDTYAPVVQWISIRMMLTLAVINEMYTTSIDFTLAFPQADVETTIYIELPLGCEIKEGDYVCKLIKNVYGTRQAARTWFEYLRDTLIDSTDDGGYGFKQSSIDPCIFYGDGITIITWVDDCLIFSKNKQIADDLIKGLDTKFSLTEEEDVSAYLGVKMEIDKDKNTVTMSQPYLIERIINLLGDAISQANVKNTPAVYKELLHKDEHGPERKQTWNYRSAVGMLNYLAASTRPDCLFAVHQCARFSSNPKLSHERAIKRIIRYLKGTKDKGIILRPDKDKGIQCYVDADFAGGYSVETSDEPVSVFSRTGYVVYYFGCPVVWVSKLQSEISLSTVEAEYIALSQSMRDLIPLLDQIKEMDIVYGSNTSKPIVKCTLFEDNNGALELATRPR